MNSAGSKPTVVGLGEVLWDCFADSRRPGGAPANVAFQANQLGCRGVVCSRVGTDPLGDELVHYLAGQDLSTAFVQRDTRHPTGMVTVDTAAAGDPQYIIHEGVAWDHLEWNETLEGLMRQATAVCFGTLAQRSEGSRRAIRRALETTAADALRVYDVNLRQQFFARSWIEPSLAVARLVKLNREEVAVLAELLELPGGDPVGFCHAVQERFAVDAVCVTRAAEGCLLVDGTAVVDVEGVDVQVVDAVGAGDAFTAAWIFARLSGWPPEQQADFANRVGALVTTRPGAMPRLTDELAALAAEFAP